MNKYYAMLGNVLDNGREQRNKKGNIRYLTNEVMRMDAGDLLDIFESHGCDGQQDFLHCVLVFNVNNSVAKVRRKIILTKKVAQLKEYVIFASREKNNKD